MRTLYVSVLTLAGLLALTGCSRSANPTAAAPPPEWQASPSQQSTAPPAVRPSPYGSEAPISGQAALPPPIPPMPDSSTPPPPDALAADRSQPSTAIPIAGSLPAGSPLAVRIDESINTRRNRVGDGFDATMPDPLMIDGQTILPAGTRFHGHITKSKPSGRLKGRAVLILTLDGFRLDGRQYRIRTNQVERESGSHKTRNAVAVGGGAGFGAAMGAIAGGGAGAAIGAAAGAGGGLVGAAATGKKEVGVRAESLLRFRLEQSVSL